MTKIFYLVCFATFLFWLRVQAETNGVQVNVRQEFRAEPVWYWKSSEGKCVPVPSHDIVSRIAPQRIREAKINSSDLPCQIALDERRIEAYLICDDRVLEKYFAKEVLCKESIRPVSAKKSAL